MAWQPLSNNGHSIGPSNSLGEGVPGPMALHPFHEELVVRREEIHRIASENTHVLEDILGLMQDLALTEDDIHILTKQTIPRLQAHKEMEYRDIIQEGMKLEEEMHALEPIKAEVSRLSFGKMELEGLCEELSVKVQSLHRELDQIQSENRKIPAIRAEMHEEILRARMAYDYEKQAKAELVEESQVMERDFLDMKMEAHRLQSELEKRGRRLGVRRA